MKKIVVYLLTCLLVLSTLSPAAAKSNSNVVVHRDEYGVPHIYADSSEDLYKAYGYVMAQDRLFQLEMFKRANEGIASEIFGQDYLAHDEKVRRDGYSDREIQQMIKKMDPFARKKLEDFASGIDAYVKEVIAEPNKLSKEFNDYQMKPERWTAVSVLRLYMASMTGFMDQEKEITNAQFLAELREKYDEEEARAIFNDHIWLNDPASPVSTNSNASSGTGTPFGGDQLEAAQEAGDELAAKRTAYIQQSEELGIPTKVGSNAVVIGPSKSKTGNPIMFGGPQVGLVAPGFMYEVGLHGPDIDIQGSSFIGYPFIMFGATDDFAFSATAGYGDVVDIFEEQLNPDNPNEYLYKGKWRKFEKKTESFNVTLQNGATKTVKKNFYYSVHGPVIWKDEDSDVAYTKAWTFRGTEADSLAAYMNMNYSSGVEDFAEAARDYTMTLDWFYADQNGNTGFFHTGKFPVRDKRIDWRLPTPGTGEYDWKGFRDPQDNPSEINSERGYIAGWNNKPSPNWNNNEGNDRWGIDNRVHKFIDGIEEHKTLTMKDVNDVNYQASFANLNEKWFKPYLLEALEKQEKPIYKQAYQIIDEWNGLNEDADHDGYYDSAPANRILNAWVEQLSANVIEDDYDKPNTALLIRILQGDQAALQPEYNWLNGESIDKLTSKSLVQAMAKLHAEYGASIKDWKPEPIKTTSFGGQSLIGVPHGYGDSTEFITMNRGSENHFVEMTEDGPVGMNVTPPGQIGYISEDGEYSQHYQDQLELYINFEYKPMLFTKEAVLRHSVNKTQISFDE